MGVGLPEHFRARRPQIPIPDGREEEGHGKGLLPNTKRRNKAQGAVTLLLLRGSLVLPQGIICKLGPCQDCNGARVRTAGKGIIY